MICSHSLGREDGDSDLIFPMLHLYRHYLELSIKALIDLCDPAESADKTNVPPTHSLVGIFKYLLDRLGKDFEKTTIGGRGQETRDISETIATLRKWTTKFHKIDRGSYCFRYPISKSVKKSKRVKKHAFPILNDVLGLRDPSELLENMKTLEEAINEIGMVIAGRRDMQSG